MRHLLSLKDLTKSDFFSILERGKKHRADRRLNPRGLDARKIALLFEKSSTRTRISFTVAIMELGGEVFALETQNLQMHRGESVEDTTEVMARYIDAIMIRARSHDTLATMASLNRLPIINGLSDRFHPCQALADYMTVEQYGLSITGGLRLAFIGEPNNVFNSLALGAIFTGAELRIASPSGFHVSDDVAELLKKNNIQYSIFEKPEDAVEGAQVIYTDVWVSMGQENEEEIRKRIFAPYCITEKLLEHAAKDHIVMHCLPAHRGEEITDGVMRKYGRFIFDQAENRLHVQKAVLEWIFGLL